MTPLFIANERFDPSAGARWTDYIRWAGIPNLTEVVSLDCVLCPRIVTEFIGCDLIEEMTQISALTNCGGFPETFSNEELNNRGLIDSFARAKEIQRLLAQNNPDEPHANCELYALWRLREAPVPHERRK